MSGTEDVHVLLVEDDEVEILAVERAFHKARIANPIVVARDGAEALEILRGGGGREPIPRPYVILLDLNMPRMNGIEFLDVLRLDPAHADAVVFVLTTSDADRDRTAAYDRHIAGYIVKSGIGDQFFDIARMLKAYWRLVVLP